MMVKAKLTPAPNIPALATLRPWGMAFILPVPSANARAPHPLSSTFPHMSHQSAVVLIVKGYISRVGHFIMTVWMERTYSDVINKCGKRNIFREVHPFVRFEVIIRSSVLEIKSQNRAIRRFPHLESDSTREVRCCLLGIRSFRVERQRLNVPNPASSGFIEAT